MQQIHTDGLDLLVCGKQLHQQMASVIQDHSNGRCQRHADHHTGAGSLAHAVQTAGSEVLNLLHMMLESLRQKMPDSQKATRIFLLLSISNPS